MRKNLHRQWIGYSGKFVKSNKSYWNLSIGATATASSYYKAGQEANKANDSNPYTWWSSASGQYNNSWLEINFGSNKSFNCTVIKEKSGYPRIQSHKIQYYNGSSWIDVVTGTTVGTNKVYTFPAVTGERVRLLVVIASNCPTIDEFEVFAN